MMTKVMTGADATTSDGTMSGGGDGGTGGDNSTTTGSGNVVSTIQLNGRKLRSQSHDPSSKGGTPVVTRKISPTVPPGQVELEHFMELAEYEVHQDPYRGMMAQQQSQEIGTDVTTPWNRCQWGVLGEESSRIMSMTRTGPSNTKKSTTTTTTTTSNCSSATSATTNSSGGFGKDHYQPLLTELSPHGLVRHVVQCACPSLVAWTKHMQKQQQQRSKRASGRASTRGVLYGKATTGATAAKKSTNGRSMNGRGKEDNDADNNNNNNNSNLYNPFQLPPRPTNTICVCDFNPLCLGSMGGVVNDILEERSQEILAVHAQYQLPTQGQGQIDERQQGEEIVDDEDEVNNDQQKETIKGKSTVVDHHPNVIDLEEGDKSSPAVGTIASQPTNEDSMEFTGEEDPNTTNHVSAVPIRSSHGAVIPSPPFAQPDTSLTVRPQEVYEIYTKEGEQLGGRQHRMQVSYSPVTQTSLQQLRKTLVVDMGPIRSYAYRTLHLGHIKTPIQQNQQQRQRLGEATTLEEYIQQLREWHRSLQFSNPVEDVNDDVTIRFGGDRHGTDQMVLSLPPGIQNLGATCYLNTQLQCLAQNTAFLQGIFSWRQPSSNHTDSTTPSSGSSLSSSSQQQQQQQQSHSSTIMNSVMSKLQYLLAQMTVGGDCKLTTLDFSNALGLEHDEQQDPNEFARLLFDRMDESFSSCGGDLSNLLQRIFHGVTTYETVCLTCQAVSARQEGFMDLNLPIVKRETKKNEKEVGPHQTTILEALGKGMVDTDVQYCLEQYLCAEMLDGDNQYFCSTCNCKRDARRSMKLTELPPVLNVQLSRYVFDREKFVKKKLTDKVLLPTTLVLAKKTYLLCAVMRHQGTSAYRGHYVAEAMDWLTGQWFEFNDDTVKLLPEGPSCSFDPTMEVDATKSGNGGNKKSKLSGSQDAYNMYYVEDSFLAQNARSSLFLRQELLNTRNDENYGEENDVLVDVSLQRDTKYALLSE